MRLRLPDGIRASREGDDFVTVAQKPLDHVAAHFPEADESEFHSSSFGIWRIAADYETSPRRFRTSRPD